MHYGKWGETSLRSKTSLVFKVIRLNNHLLKLLPWKWLSMASNVSAM